MAGTRADRRPIVKMRTAAVLERIHRDDAIALEQALVRIPSYTTEEEPLARYIFAYMRDIGLDATLMPVPLKDKQGFNVIGHIRGAGDGPSLMITGHMDHAPALGREFDDLSQWQRP